MTRAMAAGPTAAVPALRFLDVIAPKVAAASDDHMMRAGFASCAVRIDPPGHWLSVLWPRHCDKFSRSPDAQKRRLWLNKKAKP